jgi:hypothetical protein
MTQGSYPQPFLAMLRKGCEKMAVDNSCARIAGEESEHPPLTSCSQKPPFEEQKKRTTHLLRNRTDLFVDNTFHDMSSINYGIRSTGLDQKRGLGCATVWRRRGREDGSGTKDRRKGLGMMFAKKHVHGLLT